ncbi:MAG TPA: matrixin family metalloprotease [Clostridiales bacterium]|nr:matrixin family metalloprotease [Clostridiales bacterium]
MKRIRKILVAFFTVILLFTSNFYGKAESGVDVVMWCFHGYHTFNDHVLIGGVGDYGANKQYYWIHTAQMDNYLEERVRTAIYNWIYTTSNPPYVTTPISFRETTSQAVSVADFYQVDIPDDDVFAYTNLYFGGEIKNPINYNWAWAFIGLDYFNIYNYYGVNNRGFQGVAAHEFGHAMGLCHTYDVTSVMCMIGDGRQVSTPSAKDCYAINHLYA